MARALSLLAFRCTGCGNCCREPLLPLTDDDLRRLVASTGATASELVQWVGSDGIDLDDRAWFVTLRAGKRTMVLRHREGRCVFLDGANRCTAYDGRPLGCRVFPLDAEFAPRGGLRRLRLIEATECPYELDGQQRVDDLRDLKARYDAANERYVARVAEWNREMRARLRQGRQAGTGAQYLRFLGFEG